MNGEKYKVTLDWTGTEDDLDFTFDDIDKALEFVKFLLSQGYSSRVSYYFDDEEEF